MKDQMKDLEKKRDALALALERGGLPAAAAEHVARELRSVRARLEVLKRESVDAR